jgi:HAD superfamily hydrolase (TIGR01509 family)
LSREAFLNAPGPLAAVRVALTDFDRTLTRLFEDGSLKELYQDLVDMYSQCGVPSGLLASDQNPYSTWVRVYDWLTVHCSDLQAARVNHKAAKLLTKHEFDAARRAKLLPGVRDTLNWLNERKVDIVIVTSNSTKAVRRTLKTVEAVGLVRNIFGREDSLNMRRLKPSPQMLHAALRDVKGNPDQAFFIGDSQNDIIAGRGAGVFTIGVCTGELSKEELSKAGADFVLPSFAHLRRFPIGSRGTR